MAKDAIQPIKVEQVLVGEIEIYERIHNFDKVRVLSLSDDMEARGLMSPILLRKMPDGNLGLVAGRHRLAAAQLLGWETIAAIIADMTDDEAICAEIEENQQRGNLTVVERGIGLARLKGIYIKNHPDSAKGKYDRGIRDKDDLYVFSAAEALSGNKPVRFTLDEAKKQGIDEKAVKRLVQIGEAITPELQAEIHGTPLADNQAQLLALVKYPEARRPLLARIMRDEGYGKVSDADQHAEGRRPKEKPNHSEKEIWMRKIHALWSHGRKHWQDDFLTLIDAVREEKGGA